MGGGDAAAFFGVEKLRDGIVDAAFAFFEHALNRGAVGDIGEGLRDRVDHPWENIGRFGEFALLFTLRLWWRGFRGDVGWARVWPVEVSYGGVVLPSLFLTLIYASLIPRLLASMTTDVIRDVRNIPLGIVLPPRHHVRKVSLVQLHIHPKGRAERVDLHVVTIGPSSGHLLQVALKRTLNLFRCGREIVGRSRICVGILPFRIPPGTTTGVDGDVLFIVGGVFPHVFDYTSADLVVSGLGAV